MKKQKFLRTQWFQVSCLGKRRKKKLKYRRAAGIDNKIRLKMKGHLRNVSVGFRSEKKKRGLIGSLFPVYVHNIDEIERLSKNEIGILANIGNRKKTEIADYIIEKKIRLLNFNAAKFLEKNRKKRGGQKEEKLKKTNRKKQEEKRKEEIQKKKEEDEKAKGTEKENKETIEEKIGEIQKREEKDTKKVVKNNETNVNTNVGEKK